VHQESLVRRRFTLGLVATTSLLLAGCGASVPDGAADAEPMAAPEGHPDHDEVAPVGPGGDLEMDMGDFFFDNISGTPVTGEIEVTVHNVSGQYHNAEFIGAADGSDIPEAEGNESGTGTVALFPGEWEVICNVPGHREAGMETTITVYATEEEAQEAAEDGDLEAAENGAEGNGELGEQADPTDPDIDDEGGDAEDDEDGED
jgi:plastocyanin